MEKLRTAQLTEDTLHNIIIQKLENYLNLPLFKKLKHEYLFTIIDDTTHQRIDLDIDTFLRAHYELSILKMNVNFDNMSFILNIHSLNIYQLHSIYQYLIYYEDENNIELN